MRLPGFPGRCCDYPRAFFLCEKELRLLSHEGSTNSDSRLSQASCRSSQPALHSELPGLDCRSTSKSSLGLPSCVVASPGGIHFCRSCSSSSEVWSVVDCLALLWVFCPFRKQSESKTHTNSVADMLAHTVK